MLNRVIYAIAAMAMCCATVQAQELPEGYKALCIKEQGSDKTTEFQLHEIEEIVFEIGLAMRAISV